MNENKMLADYPVIDTRDGDELRFVRASDEGEKLLCWKDLGNVAGTWSQKCMVVRVSKIKPSSLKEVGVWDKLTPERQVELENFHPEAPVTPQGDAPRKRQRHDYTGVPDQLTCKCGHVQKYSKYQILKNAEAKGLSVDEYVNSYQCQKCNPTKGRRRKEPLPKIDGVEDPTKVTCTICKEQKGTTVEQMQSLSDRLDMPLPEVYAKYVCRKCNKTLPEGQKFLPKRKKRTKRS